MPIELGKVFEAARQRARKSRHAGSLWPPQYSIDSAEAAWEFCKLCKTWDEASAQTRSMPQDEHLYSIVKEWHETRASGQPLGFEKSRRMVVSWLLCVLDVWDAGLRRCNIIEAGADYQKASDFVWRCYFIYRGLQDDFPSWKLPDPETWGNPSSQHLEKMALPNQSLIESMNADSESFRGTGKTRVKLEELSSYRYVSKVLAQALIVTQGMPGQPRGHVVFVSNAAVNEEWKEVKSAPQEMQPLPSPQEVPYLAYTTRGGNRIIRLHYSASSDKDEEWVALASQGIPKTEWLREYELYDAEVDDALWTQKMIEDTRVFELPKNVIQYLVSIDPSVADPTQAKNPSRKPDEVGIIAGAVTDDFHVYIIEDASGDMSPLGWAQAGVSTYSKYHANRIIAEKNQGGEMVKMTINQVGPMVPVQLVSAKIGKRARAEPVALAYELGFVHHLGFHKGLENEMVTWSKNSTKSPGRIDALSQLVTASGILESLTGEVADRFSSKTSEPTDYIPEGALFSPKDLEEQETRQDPNPFASMGWD